ncbi:MAG: helix-turn-helix domain-containing protein [Vicinamibacterales bacterium]
MLRLGERVREERRRRGWTLHDLASRAGLSIATLSAIETHRTSADVKVAFQISAALGVPFDALLPRSTTSHYQITRRATVEAHPPAPMKLVNRARQTATPYHNRLWPLAGAFVGKYIEPFEIEIQLVREKDVKFISHNHEEFLFVLQGTIECLIKSPDGLLRETLGPGDCMHFWSYLPHCIRSTGRKPARSVHVLYSLHELADSESSDGISGPMIYLTEAPHPNVVEQVATKILLLRQTRGMSVADFARHLGISVRRLAKIERGQRPASLKLLIHICRTFRKPLEYFIASSVVERPFYRVRRADEIRRESRRGRVESGRPGSQCFANGVFTALAHEFGHRGMHPYLVRLNDGEPRASPMVGHAGQEFVYVVKGAVSLLTEHDGRAVTETLFPGDSCFVDASVPHRFAGGRFNPYDGSGAQAIAVFWHPTETRRPDTGT